MRVTLRFLEEAGGRATSCYRLEESIALESHVLRIEFDPAAGNARSLTFAVIPGASGGEDAPSLLLNLFLQILTKKGHTIRSTWNGRRLEPGSTERVSFDLPFEASALDGQTARVGFQVRGRKDFGTYSFRGRLQDGRLVLEP